MHVKNKTELSGTILTPHLNKAYAVYFSIANIQATQEAVSYFLGNVLPFLGQKSSSHIFTFSREKIRSDAFEMHSKYMLMPKRDGRGGAEVLKIRFSKRVKHVRKTLSEVYNFLVSFS